MTAEEKAVLNVAECAKLLGLSKNATYEAIRTKQIPSLRIGDRILVPRRALDQMLSGHGQQQPESGVEK